MRTLLAAVSLVVLTHPARALEPWPSGKLQLELEKLAVLGSALYVAAHPDDENTKLIAYLANESKVRTTYLSLTRGDGGQNLLGADLGEKLGLIRTQELLAARRIDGGEQLFSRAIDFGYSKTPEESLEIWGHEAILADVVRAIRSTRPDIIINRFSDQPGFTHGHHTASAWLAREAFAAAADPTRFPEQLESLEPWAAKRLLWNTSPWFYSRRNIEFDPTGLVAVDVGTYLPLLGKSIAEIAALSRSAHQTQGFGATPELGQSPEYFALAAGEPLTNSLFDGVDTTWTRVPDSAPVADAIQRAIEAFSPTAPSRAVPDLIAAHRALTALPDDPWRTRKLSDLARVIAACLALDVESVSPTPTAVTGSEITLTLAAIQRSPLDVRSNSPHPAPHPPPSPQTNSFRSPPPWPSRPKSPPPLLARRPARTRSLHRGLSPADRLAGEPTRATRSVPRHRRRLPARLLDPDDLQLQRPRSRRGEGTVRPHASRDGQPLRSHPDFRRFETTQNLRPHPRRHHHHRRRTPLRHRGRLENRPALHPFRRQRRRGNFRRSHAHPARQASQSILSAELVIDDRTTDLGIERVEYDHIPTQTLFPTAEVRLVVLDVKTAGERIGYVPGAGDAIPEALQRIGYRVDTLGEDDLRPANLAPYDAIVLGIRALNTNARIEHYLPALFDYASAGGVIIIQYNTSRGLQTEQFSPVPITLSRDRVTDETAVVRFLAPDHPVLNFPNAITAADFDGWVQERGLYFASEWDPAFTPIFSINDADEDPLDGSLLIARTATDTSSTPASRSSANSPPASPEPTDSSPTSFPSGTRNEARPSGIQPPLASHLRGCPDLAHRDDPPHARVLRSLRMSGLDWFTLLGTVVGIVAYGLWTTRRHHSASDYLRGGNDLKWGTIGLSVMATQASAITFLSTPGQGYERGLAFVQNYLGLPIALVIISAVFVPIYYRLRVTTAYEFLGQRFDQKTRTPRRRPLPRPARARRRHHDLRPGHHRLHHPRLAAQPHHRPHRRARHPLHRHRRHPHRQPHPEIPDARHPRRDGHRLRLRRPRAAGKSFARRRLLPRRTRATDSAPSTSPSTPANATRSGPGSSAAPSSPSPTSAPTSPRSSATSRAAPPPPAASGSCSTRF